MISPYPMKKQKMSDTQHYETVQTSAMSDETLLDEMKEMLLGGWQLINHQTKTVQIWTWERPSLTE
jgi:hypothetical protein